MTHDIGSLFPRGMMPQRDHPSRSSATALQICPPAVYSMDREALHRKDWSTPWGTSNRSRCPLHKCHEHFNDVFAGAHQIKVGLDSDCIEEGDPHRIVHMIIHYLQYCVRSDRFVLFRVRVLHRSVRTLQRFFRERFAQRRKVCEGIIVWWGSKEAKRRQRLHSLVQERMQNGSPAELREATDMYQQCFVDDEIKKEAVYSLYFKRLKEHRELVKKWKESHSDHYHALHEKLIEATATLARGIDLWQRGHGKDRVTLDTCGEGLRLIAATRPVFDFSKNSITMNDLLLEAARYTAARRKPSNTERPVVIQSPDTVSLSPPSVKTILAGQESKMPANHPPMRKHTSMRMDRLASEARIRRLVRDHLDQAASSDATAGRSNSLLPIRQTTRSRSIDRAYTPPPGVAIPESPHRSSSPRGSQSVSTSPCRQGQSPLKRGSPNRSLSRSAVPTLPTIPRTEPCSPSL
eukprot:Sspe_Gene.117921::Locus_110312_Transcript_1_1_Confidence_1.000_Length_1637::g.117921::m.117921